MPRYNKQYKMATSDERNKQLADLFDAAKQAKIAHLKAVMHDERESHKEELCSRLPFDTSKADKRSEFNEARTPKKANKPMTLNNIFVQVYSEFKKKEMHERNFKTLDEMFKHDDPDHSDKMFSMARKHYDMAKKKEVDADATPDPILTEAMRRFELQKAMTNMTLNDGNESEETETF